MAEKKKATSASSEVLQANPRGEKDAPARKESKQMTQRREGRQQEVRREQKPSVFARLLQLKLFRFPYEAYYELRYKVTWPTFEEARNMTIAVIALSLALGIVLGLVDIGLFQLFRLVTGSAR
jgi:preprotein translocase SecE subunit